MCSIIKPFLVKYYNKETNKNVYIPTLLLQGNDFKGITLITDIITDERTDTNEEWKKENEGWHGLKNPIESYAFYFVFPELEYIFEIK